MPAPNNVWGAEILGVSRERVYQLTSLVTKLPPQIKNFLARSEDPSALRFFTKRRLRPLTVLTDQDAQIAAFRRLAGFREWGGNSPIV